MNAITQEKQPDLDAIAEVVQLFGKATVLLSYPASSLALGSALYYAELGTAKLRAIQPA